MFHFPLANCDGFANLNVLLVAGAVGFDDADSDRLAVKRKDLQAAERAIFGHGSLL
jgi:hypothetical protein